ncbi:MAG TPA: type II toxin-antitoxin system RelE/ParE family toxin [Candidatus Acidoferrales bacterium]|nr:type II toxin-antitoxin system RelE/ParE family toxin [Candidatus Acidoferrales bacterium]
MSDFVLTPIARADLFEIWAYIAEDSETAADRVEQAIYEACASLSSMPLAGHSRPDLTSLPVRFWNLRRYPNFMIVYRPETRPVQIVAVLHGKRNIERILTQRG